MRSFTLTLNVPAEPAVTRTVSEADLRFAVNDLIAGDLPEGAELTLAAAPAEQDVDLFLGGGQPVPLFA